ncbi:MAG: hypothetical protein LBG74_02985 [Spirochaetaceae bacterium]|jgi:hypothetical protein|nr:hypothetical protein [Spirochaetaceae bacterium]
MLFAKRNILTLLYAVFVVSGLSAQEMQISGGPEFGIGVFEIDNSFVSGPPLLLPTLYKEKIDAAFLAPGVSFAVRSFSDTSRPVQAGFIFRDRAIFITNVELTGTVSRNASSERLSESYSAADNDFFIGLLDFDTGVSVRHILSKRLQFYTDLGVNFSIMQYKNFETYDTLDYWGMGLFAALSLQVNLVKTMYLEFGLNTIMNLLSNQEGYRHNLKADYEDSGRTDLTSIAVYVHIGWRIDLKKYAAVPSPETAAPGS